VFRSFKLQQADHPAVCFDLSNLCYSLRFRPELAANQPPLGSSGMNNRQHQLLIAFLASMGLGLLGGLAFNVTFQMIRPGKVDLDPALPHRNGRPERKVPARPEQNRSPSESECVVPPGGGPPVTKDFKPC